MKPGQRSSALLKTALLIIVFAAISGCSDRQEGTTAIMPVPLDRPASVPQSTFSDDSAVADVPVLASLGIRDIGAAPSKTMLTIAVTLRYRNQKRLDQLVAAQSNGNSRQYHRWLSNAQFNAQFAPTSTDYRRVRESLSANGFHVGAPYTNNTVVDARGSVLMIERYFKTSVHQVNEPGYGMRYVNTKPASAPPDVADVLFSVDGLDTIVTVQTDHVASSRVAERRRWPQGTRPGLYGPLNKITGLYGYGPVAFQVAYDLPI